MEYKKFTLKDYEKLKQYVYNNIKNYSMLELIMDFIESNHFWFLDVVDFIKSDKEFKDLFLRDLKKHNQIYFKEGKNINFFKQKEIW